jgi:uncharacterized repeat protein (TIGR03803 family)
VVEGTDGNFYGTSQESTDSPYGFIYRVKSDSSYATIFSFSLTNGGGPLCKLIQARDGNLYGTTFSGGPAGTNGFGVIFRINIPSAAAPKVRDLTMSSTNAALSWNAIPTRNYRVQYATDPGLTNWSDLGSDMTASNSIANASDPATTDPVRLYRVILLP